MLWKIRVLTRNIRIPTLLLLLGGTALVAPHSVTQQQICKLGMQEAGQGGEADSDKIIIDPLRI